MRCPFCDIDKDKVIDSRATDGGRSIRRRRQCLSCNKRFTTYETVEEKVSLQVVKKDMSRVPYSKDKLIAGVEKAAYKRPVSVATISALAESVEEDLFRMGEKEIASTEIGLLVLNKLRAVDHVAYMRFASVYMDVDKVDDLLDEMQQVREDAANAPPREQGKLF
ncbi:MAG: transcriptional regulator NrdR [Phycisphaeraceae bacterium]